MKYHALVIDDNQAILEDVKDRLESLGHTCDCAMCQLTAREHINKNGYSYVLLDLEIPIKYGRPSRIQNGKNLIQELRSVKGHENIPILVMTTHGHDSPDLATEVLRHNGATDFVGKPFPTSGKTLEKAVQEALDHSGRSRPGGAAISKPQIDRPPQKFESGPMVFYLDRVELCGVVICRGDVIMQKVLQQLCMKKANGKYCAYPGEKLADLIGAESARAISGAIRDFRRHVSEELKREANIDCGKDDVIISGGPGYRFSEKIIVQMDQNAIDAPSDPHLKSVENTDESLNDRQNWIMGQLQKNGRIIIGRVIEQFKCSNATAKRDLNELRDKGFVEFAGAGQSGYWKTKA